MARGDKSKETFEKAAEFFKKRADREYAQGKNDEGGFHFNNAKKNYETVMKALNSAKKK